MCVCVNGWLCECVDSNTLPEASGFTRTWYPGHSFSVSIQVSQGHACLRSYYSWWRLILSRVWLRVYSPAWHSGGGKREQKVFQGLSRNIKILKVSRPLSSFKVSLSVPLLSHHFYPLSKWAVVTCSNFPRNLWVSFLPHSFGFRLHKGAHTLATALFHQLSQLFFQKNAWERWLECLPGWQFNFEAWWAALDSARSGKRRKRGIIDVTIAVCVRCRMLRKVYLSSGTILHLFAVVVWIFPPALAEMSNFGSCVFPKWYPQLWLPSPIPL